LLNNRIDLAVHSMKDVPTQLPKGIIQSAVLKRASYKDLFVYKNESEIKDWKLDEVFSDSPLGVGGIIATSSIRRKAQWLNRYPNHTIENLRGNVNTRLKKVTESNWHGAIFAAAGLERINVRPETSIELEWMLPAPAQGAIVVLCRQDDTFGFDACQAFNDEETALCTKIEKEFLRTLLGGCSTPISALAQIKDARIIFKGNIFSVDGTERVDIEKSVSIPDATNLGISAAIDLLAKGGKAIAEKIHHER
ncbi:MAG TPA: hydroxymethylbilane synthase, partial [Segetibacter sp.]